MLYGLCHTCCTISTALAIIYLDYLVMFLSLYICVYYVITAQSLVVECEATTVSNHIDIDCITNRPPQITFCSFNRGPKVNFLSLASSSLHHISHYLCIVCVCFVVYYYTGSYTLAINRDVSPIGNYTLTVFVRDDEGFEADATVQYILEQDSKPTGGSLTFTFHFKNNGCLH